MTFPPTDDVLIAFGNMTLEFAELEYWVNMGIIEAEHITDGAQQAKVSGLTFTKRIERLSAALAEVEAKGWKKFGPDDPVDFVPDLTGVAAERNDFVRGAAFTLLTASEPRQVRHGIVNLKTGSQRYLDVPTVEELTGRIRGYAGRLQFAVMNLCLAKQAKGIGGLTCMAF